MVAMPKCPVQLPHFSIPIIRRVTKMKYLKQNSAMLWLLAMLVWGTGFNVAASDVASQTLQLEPGWNAVFVELEPDDDNGTTADDNVPARVFNLGNIEMVWAMPRTTSTIQYISQPSEIGINDPDWHVYIPASQPTAALTNLHAVTAGRVYLIKVAGTQTQQLVIHGRPQYKRIQWRAESFNLVGFHADPDPQQQVSFAQFLGLPSSSNPSIFKLTGNTWTLISKNSLVEHGRGYWVYNDGTFNRSGPLDINDSALNGLGFGELGTVKALDLVNRSSANMSAVSLAVAGFPLKYFGGYGGASGLEPQWLNADGLSFAINSGKNRSLMLAVDRAQVAQAVSGIVALRGGGMRIQLPLGAESLAAGYDGLWVGTVVLNEVSNVNAANPAASERTPAEMTMKLLLHSGNNQVHLLKQVYILGDYSNPADPRTVLVTDDLALPDFVPLELARGENRGRRLSSAAFDFAGTKLPLAGDFALGLSGDIVLNPSLPTHPMKHRRNPDHDNLRDDNGTQLPAAGLSSFEEEVWPITRHITLAPDELREPAPNTGMGELVGVYQETVTGLHKQNIVMKGRFNLQRVSQINTLDPVLQ